MPIPIPTTSYGRLVPNRGIFPLYPSLTESMAEPATPVNRPVPSTPAPIAVAPRPSDEEPNTSSPILSATTGFWSLPYTVRAVIPPSHLSHTDISRYVSEFDAIQQAYQANIINATETNNRLQQLINKWSVASTAPVATTTAPAATTAPVPATTSYSFSPSTAGWGYRWDKATGNWLPATPTGSTTGYTMSPSTPYAPTRTPIPSYRSGANLDTSTIEEPLIAIGERTGKAYFRFGEVPEQVKIKPIKSTSGPTKGKHADRGIPSFQTGGSVDIIPEWQRAYAEIFQQQYGLPVTVGGGFTSYAPLPAAQQAYQASTGAPSYATPISQTPGAPTYLSGTPPTYAASPTIFPYPLRSQAPSATLPRITPPSTGSGGLADVRANVNVRPFDEIKATGYYENDEERAFYLLELQRRGITLSSEALAFLRGIEPSQGAASAAPVARAAPIAQTVPSRSQSTGSATTLYTPNGYRVDISTNGIATFPPRIEQYRADVIDVFGENLANAILWIIAQESGGDPTAVNGRYYGLLQSDAPGARGDVRQQLLSAYNDKYISSLKDYPIGAGLAPWGYNNRGVQGGASSLPPQFAPR